MDYSRATLVDRLAADYVAGTLRGPARRRLETLLPAHPLLRAAVVAWQDRLLPLTGTLAPVAPPASVWQRIEARLGFDAGSAAGAAGAARTSSGFWGQLGFWRAFSGLALVAAVGFGVLYATPSPSPAPVVIVLNATGTTVAGNGSTTTASFVAGISADGRAVVTKPITTVALEPDRSFELWAVPGTGAPRSLGLISAQAATTVRQAGVPQGTAALAVSLEPRGGSPTGAPTGPVLFVGKL